MNAADQLVILLFTMRSLKSEGSWCGETHVQKTLYLCQELVLLPSAFKFVLYKHGPYSFEISDSLQGLIADDLVLMLSRPPYGPSLEVASSAFTMADRINRTPELESRIRFLTSKLGKKNVVELEKLATSVYVNNKYGIDIPLEAKAKSLNAIKPHVSLEAAKVAFLEVENIRNDIHAHSYDEPI